MAEVLDARVERDKALKDLHTAQLESQSWKQETASTKAVVSYILGLGRSYFIHLLMGF